MQVFLGVETNFLPVYNGVEREKTFPVKPRVLNELLELERLLSVVFLFRDALRLYKHCSPSYLLPDVLKEGYRRKGSVRFWKR